MSHIENPKVTVLMPVYNGAKFLHEAIESILNQTFSDFEFLIINDGSTDKSVEIMGSYNDSRIRLVHNEKNLGLVQTLNKGLKLARGEYIARMDCDDISLPLRLEKQVRFMDSNQEVGICGTCLKTIESPIGNIWGYPTDSNTIKCKLLFGSAVAHPTVIFRNEVLKMFNLAYNQNYIYAEDYELWVRTLKFTSLANIGEVLLLHRLHPNQIGQKYNKEQYASSNLIRYEQLKNLGLIPSEKELHIHQLISLSKFEINRAFIDKVESWLLKLKNANDQALIYPEPFFSRVLAERWFATCSAATALGFWIWDKLWRSPLSSKIDLNLKQKIKYAVKCGIRWQK